MRKLRAVFSALFDPLVVVTLMTTLALIVGLLAYETPKPSHTVVGLCLSIGAMGLVTIILQVRAITNREHARERLGAFLEEGQELFDTPPRSQATGEEANAWNAKVNSWILAVESFLTKHSKSGAVVFKQHTMSPRYGLRVSLRAENWFYELAARLKTLRSIIEKPDVYF